MDTGMTRAQASALSALFLMNGAFRKKFLLFPQEAAMNYLGITLTQEEIKAIEKTRAALKERGAQWDKEMEDSVTAKGGKIPFIVAQKGGGSADDGE